MKHNIYAVFDLAAQAFLPPFLAPTEAIATRSFAQIACDPKSEISKYPYDYALYSLGEWDDTTAEYAPTLPRNLGLAATFRAKAEPNAN